MIKRVGPDNCVYCELYQYRSKIVKNVVNTDAEICFHGLGPGTSEDKSGNPFVGDAGRILRKAIDY
jgi:uracil-DNA glycosylase family 4